jgi:hypothetical protein
MEQFSETEDREKEKKKEQIQVSMSAAPPDDRRVSNLAACLNFSLCNRSENIQNLRN